MPLSPTATVSIYDYPEHLNPFFDDDNHNKIRFWTRTKNLVRSNSFSFSRFNESFKGIRSSFRSRKSSLSATGTESSPIILRKNNPDEKVAILDQNGFLIRSNEKKYYQAALPLSPYLPDEAFQPSVTSTPRKTFPYASPRFGSLDRDAGAAWKRSTVSLNPFEETNGTEFRRHNSLLLRSGGTLPRKKKRAPPPPASGTTINKESPKNDSGIDIGDLSSPNQSETSNFTDVSLQITESDLADSPVTNKEPPLDTEQTVKTPDPEEDTVDQTELQQIIQSIIDLNKDELQIDETYPETGNTIQPPTIIITPTDDSPNCEPEENVNLSTEPTRIEETKANESKLPELPYRYIDDPVDIEKDVSNEAISCESEITIEERVSNETSTRTRQQHIDDPAETENNFSSAAISCETEITIEERVSNETPTRTRQQHIDDSTGTEKDFSSGAISCETKVTIEEKISNEMSTRTRQEQPSEPQVIRNDNVETVISATPVPFPRTSARRSLLKQKTNETNVDKLKPNPIPKPKRSHLHKIFAWTK